MVPHRTSEHVRTGDDGTGSNIGIRVVSRTVYVPFSYSFCKFLTSQESPGFTVGPHLKIVFLIFLIFTFTYVRKRGKIERRESREKKVKFYNTTTTLSLYESRIFRSVSVTSWVLIPKTSFGETRRRLDPVHDFFVLSKNS